MALSLGLERSPCGGKRRLPATPLLSPGPEQGTWASEVSSPHRWGSLGHPLHAAGQEKGAVKKGRAGPKERTADTSTSTSKTMPPSATAEADRPLDHQEGQKSRIRGRRGWGSLERPWEKDSHGIPIQCRVCLGNGDALLWLQHGAGEECDAKDRGAKGHEVR